MTQLNIINIDDPIVNALCMQLLDACLRLPPVSEFIESLQNLFTRAEDSVSKYAWYLGPTSYLLQIRQQVLRSFIYRLKDRTLDLKTSQSACLAFLPHLTSIVEESPNVSLKHTAIACIDLIAEMFGKKAVAAIVASARIVARDECLRASESSLRIISILCLATMVEVLSDNFISILPLALSKAMDSLATSVREDTDDGALHNAVYSFFGALILYVPWMLTGADLDSILKLSFESANAEMGEECDHSRIEALRLVPKKVEARKCLISLERTWSIAMTEGPLVSPK